MELKRDSSVRGEVEEKRVICLLNRPEIKGSRTAEEVLRREMVR
jgi:hypothetical protein